MFCTNCGNKNENGAKFCPHCGGAVDDTPATQAIIEVPTSTPPETSAKKAKLNKKHIIFGSCFLVAIIITIAAFMFLRQSDEARLIGVWYHVGRYDAQGVFHPIVNVERGWIREFSRNGTMRTGFYNETPVNVEWVESKFYWAARDGVLYRFAPDRDTLQSWLNLPISNNEDAPLDRGNRFRLQGSRLYVSYSIEGSVNFDLVYNRRP